MQLADSDDVRKCAVSDANNVFLHLPGDQPLLSGTRMAFDKRGMQANSGRRHLVVEVVTGMGQGEGRRRRPMPRNRVQGNMSFMR
ncbi:hypothetical protein [Zobellella denitrificans]